MTPRNREEPVYSGTYAATKKDAVYLPTTDGPLKKTEIVVAVNAASDPVLAASARDGTLNAQETHGLAVVFTYHDPTERKFALVIPMARAHEELHIRAEMLRKLADDRSGSIAGYVRELVTVVGPEALRSYLANS